MPTFKVGTRRSRLALVQTHIVRRALQAAWPDVHLEVVARESEGDRMQGSLDSGGRGVFTSDLENAVESGAIDCAVHSLKDLPTTLSTGIELGAVFDRETARDALLSKEGHNLDSLPPGASVGTSSTRRRAQILARRPNLSVVPIRGNVETRIQKMQDGAVDAVVLAQAGLRRLDIPHDPGALVPLGAMLPAPGQGALAVQCRADHAELLERLQAVDCAEARQTTTAERTFLEALGGGCAAPIAALAVIEPGGAIRLQGMVSDAEGTRMIRVSGEGRRPRALGRRLAEEALGQGAQEVLGGE